MGLALILIWYLIPFVMPLFIPPAPVPPPGDFVGSVSLTTYTRDAFVTTDPRALDIAVHRLVGGEYIAILRGNGTVTLGPADRGRIYLSLEHASNYVDVEMTRRGLLPYFQRYELSDIDRDGYDEHVFTLWLNEENVRAPAGVTPSISLVCYAIEFDAALRFNSPADITGIGPDPESVWVLWHWVWSRPNVGARVVELHVYTNVTSEDEIRLVRVESALGTFGREAITFEPVNRRWVVRIPAELLKYQEGMSPHFAFFNCLFEVNFDASRAIEVRIETTIERPDWARMRIDDPVLLVQ